MIYIQASRIVICISSIAVLVLIGASIFAIADGFRDAQNNKHLESNTLVTVEIESGDVREYENLRLKVSTYREFRYQNGDTVFFPMNATITITKQEIE